MAFKMDFNCHGKGRVRLVKVTRGKDGKQDIFQVTVQILLEGWDMEDSFTEGNNAKVVPTDTCKNTVYCVANQHEFSSIEEFGMILGRHFLSEYSNIVRKVDFVIKQDNWERLVVPDRSGRMMPHQHAFKRVGPQHRFTHVIAERPSKNADIKFKVQSGFKSLEILKTTQSGFVNFHKCKYTSLPEATDRLLGTSADVEWIYNEAQVRSGSINYNKTYEEVEAALIRTFAGPADVGVYSPSVQETLYKMGGAVLKAVNCVNEITLYMPNIHNMVFNLDQYGLRNKDHTGNPNIFYPIDEPHGMIKATLTRSGRARL